MEEIFLLLLTTGQSRKRKKAQSKNNKLLAIESHHSTIGLPETLTNDKMIQFSNIHHFYITCEALSAWNKFYFKFSSI